MQHRTGYAAPRLSPFWALALTTSMLILGGCVSADPKETASLLPAETAVADAAATEPTDGTVQDQQVVALGTNGQPGDQASSNAMMPDTGNGQPASLVIQTSGLKATSSSIFASQVSPAGQMPVDPAAAVDAGATGTGEQAGPLPVLENQPGVQPATNSLFQTRQQPAAEAVPLPLEGASNGSVPAQPSTELAASVSILPDNAAPLEMPTSVPLPLSAVAALQGETAGKLQSVTAQPVSVTETVSTPTQQLAAVPQTNDSGTEESDAKPGFTLASLFAGKRKNRNTFDGNRFAKADARKTIARSAVQQQVASLGYNALPGVRSTSMFATVDDSQAVHDDSSGTIEVASLPGLARLAPNGLWLQTEKVDTGCFKPELLQVLKIVENHYGRKVMVTSGRRDLKASRIASGRKQSLHTTCQAADIQIPGVGKWELAEYLRTIPGRGGVGTYCHTESVHIDIGSPRDWNWRCRRRKG